MKKNNAWTFIPLAFFIFGSIFLWRALFLEPQNLPSALIGQPLPVKKLENFQERGKFLDITKLKGQFYLLNIWASWCPACVQEQVFLLELSQEGIPILGLNYKDKPQAALNWLQAWGNPYTLIAQDPKGELGLELGVYGAPETFLIDDKGIIRYRQVGVLDETSWKENFLPIIRKNVT